MTRCAIAFFFMLLCLRVHAQEKETLPTEKDTLSIEQLAETDRLEIVEQDTSEDKRTPAQATLYSAVLPGLGQAYNKKYWKIPIIYGTAAFLGFIVDFNHDQYIAFRTLLLAETDSDPGTINDSPFSEEVLRRNTDSFRRDRDFSIGLLIVLYALNIIDAQVDGHLDKFAIDDELSLEIKPSFQEVSAFNNHAIGISLSLNFY